MNNQKQTLSVRKEALAQYAEHLQLCNIIENGQAYSDWLYKTTGQRTGYDELRLEWNRQALMLKTNRRYFCKHCKPKLQLSGTYGEFGDRIDAKRKLNSKYAKYGNQ